MKKQQVTPAQFPLIIALLGEGQVAAAEILGDLKAAGYTATHLQIMELALKMYPQYQNGLAFDATYKKLLNKELGLQLLQGFVDLDMLPKHLHSVLPTQK